MDEKFAAVVYKAVDSGENDKRVTLITPFGVRQAVMRGVKRPNARLRAAALPFAFFEYTAAKKGDYYTITGAAQIEDLFLVSCDPYMLTAGGIILESAYAALKTECPAQFVYMLKRLKDVIYSDNPPYLAAIRFLQYLIHDAGYGYDYKAEEGELNSPIKLLSALHFVAADNPAGILADEFLIIKTLIKIIDNFEKKFETTIQAKKLLTVM